LTTPLSWSWTAARMGSHSIWYGRAGRLDHVLTLNWPIRLDFLAQFTGFLGLFPTAMEWKVMGLAPLRQKGIDLSSFINPNNTPYRVNTKNTHRRRPAVFPLYFAARARHAIPN